MMPNRKKKVEPMQSSGNAEKPIVTGSATKDCPARYAFFTRAEDGTLSKIPIYCCRLRHGFMIKHWKCVGLDNKECPNHCQ